MDGTTSNPRSHAAAKIAEKAQQALPGWSALLPDLIHLDCLLIQSPRP